MSALDDALAAVLNSRLSYCKFLSANDTGENGSHQAGIYIAKNAWPILFDAPGERGSNKSRRVRITWPDDLATDSRFIYYGSGSRDEYRVTSFGRNFPWLRPRHTGSLFILVKNDDDAYSAFALDSDEEMDRFMEATGVGPAETNSLIGPPSPDSLIIEADAIREYVSSHDSFPSTAEMARASRGIWNLSHRDAGDSKTKPDATLLRWIDTEYRLFRSLEIALYLPRAREGFENMDEFLNLANTALNRRKSRAGASFELHLAALFSANELSFTSQARTEGNRRPDFIFPSEDAYRDPSFPVEKLVMLAAKTTCKDRWRQILTEAGRLDGRIKYLCTLQQGVSRDQLDEMEEERVRLVVPKEYLSSFPADRRQRIWTLERFIAFAGSLND
ncbi:MAG: type II restriction endonuclease [Desulfovibrio sp.]|nr:type II restriction endonuclease [Desulfovibrio sp.]